MQRWAFLITFLAGAWLLVSCASVQDVEQTSDAPPLNIPMTKAPVLDQEGRFHFAIMGDRTGQARPGVFESALEAVNRLQPAFVISVGDQIEGYTDDSTVLGAEWSEFEGWLDTRLDMRFYYSVGNHDVFDSQSAELWKTRRGAPYYSFTYKDVLFLVLNTEDPFVTLPPEIQARSKALKEAFKKDPDGTQARVLEAVRNRPEPVTLPGQVAISEEQLAFVEQTLADHQDVRWTFVFVHKPAWQYDSAEFKTIETMLGARPSTFIAGHKHYYDHETDEGRDYITMGTSGGLWLKDGPGRVDHTLWVTMTDEGPVFANIKTDHISGVEGF